MGQLETGDEVRKDGAFLNRENRPLCLNRFNHQNLFVFNMIGEAT